MNAERENILNLVSLYADKYHKKGYKKGDKIPHAGRVYDKDELVNLVDSALDFWLTADRYAQRFERDLASFLNIRYCSLVNSGSSANLLAFMSLTSPLLGDRAVKPGDEIITAAAAFPTTVSPIIQFGAIPVFVDITIPQYNIDVSVLDAALSSKTKAVMIAHTLGNPFDISTVKAFCNKHNLWLIEDNCDALGSLYEINGSSRYTGTIGDIGTLSFYPAHHITMGEGGAVCTNNQLLNRIINSFRDWGRDCICPGGHDNTCGHRFDFQYGDLPKGYDHKFVYSHFGYNLKATDLQAAIGCAQLQKLPYFIHKRRENWFFLREKMNCLSDSLILPEPAPYSNPSWFGFLLTTTKDCIVSRDAIVSYLEHHNIQTRMLFSGNITKQPCFTSIVKAGYEFRIVGSLDITDRCMSDSFWVGIYPGINEEMLDEIALRIKEVLKKA